MVLVKSVRKGSYDGEFYGRVRLLTSVVALSSGSVGRRTTEHITPLPSPPAPRQPSSRSPTSHRSGSSRGNAAECARRTFSTCRERFRETHRSSSRHYFMELKTYRNRDTILRSRQRRVGESTSQWRRYRDTGEGRRVESDREISTKQTVRLCYSRGKLKW